ncbi:unnamed protein product, partial [Staurois parvus]
MRGPRDSGYIVNQGLERADIVNAGSGGERTIVNAGECRVGSGHSESSPGER